MPAPCPRTFTWLSRSRMSGVRTSKDKVHSTKKLQEREVSLIRLGCLLGSKRHDRVGAVGRTAAQRVSIVKEAMGGDIPMG